MLNKKPINKLRTAIILASVIVIPAQQSLAEGFLLEEVIVTAQKREQSVNDISMAVTAFRGDDLEKMGLSDTRDMAGLVPGLTMARSGQGTPIYTLRGVGFNTPDMSSTSPVGVYIDEVSYPYPLMSKGLTFDVERVEVLKGPQGTLYGRNTTGGVINYIANKPTEEFEASVKAEYGRFDTYSVETMVNGALLESVNARLAVKTNRSGEGWQKSVSRDDTLGEKEKTGARLTLDWEISNNMNALVTLGWWEDKSDAQAPQVTALELDQPAFTVPGLEAEVITNPDNQDADWNAPGSLAWGGTTFTEPAEGFGTDTEMHTLAARFDWYLRDDLTFTSITSYADLERSDLLDQDGTYYEMISSHGVGTIESFSQEFRVAGETDTLKYIGGVFYSKDNVEDSINLWGGQTSPLNALRAAAAFYGYGVEAENGFRDWQNFANIETETRAVFGQLEWALADTINVTAGIRYTEDNTDFEGCSRDIDGDGNIQALWNPTFGVNVQPGECITFKSDYSAPVDGPVVDTLSEDNVSGRLALDWQATDETLLYASFSRGFKSGNFPVGSANVASQFSPVNQEELKAYEIGVKSSLSENLQLNMAAYYYDYTDKQVFGRAPDPVFTVLTRLVNVPKSEVKGAELDLTWNVNDALVTRVSASYMETEVTEYSGLDKLANSVDFSGSEFEYSPHLQFNALASYRLQLPADLAVQVTLDASYTSDQQGDFVGADAYKVDAYTLWGLNASLMPSSEDWELSLWARNLTDEYYWTSAVSTRDTITRFAGMPRTLGMSVNYVFH